LHFTDYGLRINALSISATKVNANSITNGAAYPPVASRTLLEAAATNEPAIDVNVIRAMLPEKFFMPKKDDVNAVVIVGQDPYDIPVRHKPATHITRESAYTATSVTAAAQMVKIFALSIVLRLPIASNTAPVIILPRPLHTESTPTRDTAKDSGALTDKARSLAKLITELPTAARNEMQINAIQNEGRHSICDEV
jgi:hypothetical protein